MCKFPRYTAAPEPISHAIKAITVEGRGGLQGCEISRTV
jgi:hypothetical protein